MMRKLITLLTLTSMGFSQIVGVEIHRSIVAAAPSSIAWVQQQKNEASGVQTSISVQLNGVQINDFLFFGCQWILSGIAGLPNDSQGQVVTNLTAPAWGGGAVYNQQTWYVKATFSGTHILSLPLPLGSQYPSCILTEYSGASTTSPIDGSAQSKSGNSAPPLDCVAQTTASPNGGVIAIFASQDNTAFAAGGNSFTHRAPDANGTGVNAAIYDRLNIAAGTYTPEATGPAANNWVCSVVGIK